MDQSPVDYSAFNRYVEGTASAPEAELVRRWLADPVNTLVAQHWMRTYWDSLAETPEEVPDLRHLRTAVRAKLEGDVAEPALLAQFQTSTPGARPMLRVNRLRKWSALAALGLAVVGSAWIGIRQLTQPSLGREVEQYSTAYRQMQDLQLADGSRVVLNANSTLRYAPATSDGPREAWLDGEGYFEVQHQPDDRHFIVHTTDGPDVEVLGTRFNVYRRHGRVEVVLISGKVRVSFPNHQHAAVMMRPGEQVSVVDQQPAALVHQAVTEPATYAAWKDGRIVMHEMPISELAARLHDTYGVEIEVRGEELKNRKISGTLIVSDLDVLMITLRQSFKLNVKQEDGRIIVSDN
jgi:transmembrane sensor